MKSHVRDYVLLVRPEHWVKNCLVIAPSFFAGILFENLNNLLVGLTAFFSFSFITSVGYILNDLADRESDRNHKVKKNRPIASGKIQTAAAVIVGMALLALGMFMAFKINLSYVPILICYLVVSSLYTLLLKNIVIIELFFISFGFLLRIFAGGISCNIPISGWFILLTLFLSLLLAFGKRRTELNAVNKGANFKKVLNNYNASFLDSGVLIFSTMSIIIYSLYLIYKGMDGMLFTIPLVCFGILRYIYLINVKSKGEPTDALLNDIWLLFCVVLWLVTNGIIIYFFDSKGFV